jgi:hypothetical protein
MGDVVDLDAVAVDPRPPAADARRAHDTDTIGRMLGLRFVGRACRSVRRLGSRGFYHRIVAWERTARQREARSVAVRGLQRDQLTHVGCRKPSLVAPLES